MKAWLFNPENDLALADGGALYTPPKGAMAVAVAGALLPMLWADDDDVVVVCGNRNLSSGDMAVVESTLRERYGARGRVLYGGPLEGYEPAPWGWSRYATRLFERAGMGRDALPGNEAMERVRQLSHRRISVDVNRHIAMAMPQLVMPPLPVETDSYGVIGELTARYEREGYRGVVVKLPWSCSSRGVVMTGSGELEQKRTQLEGMIRRQGSVMVEPWVERVMDFATLYEADGNGGVVFKAFSLFVTDDNGRYAGNLVLDQSDMAQRIGALPPRLTDVIATALSASIGCDYKGWIGVDMMRYAHGSTEGVAPCVEVNLRMTMGVAAWLVSRRVTDKVLNVTPAGIMLKPLTNPRHRSF